MILFTFLALFAFVCYAHGMEWWLAKMPTGVNRILCILIMSAASGMICLPDEHKAALVAIWCLPTIALWIWPGWMSEVTDAIGANNAVSRLHGLIEMTARQLLFAPCILGLCFLSKNYTPALGLLTMGLPYTVVGVVGAALHNTKRSSYIVVASHAIVGLIIGSMIWLSTR